jgi:hypothetical protein
MIKNIKKGIITTILGVLLILVGVFYTVYPLIREVTIDISSTILTIVFVFGAGLLIAPDNFLSIIKDKINIQNITGGQPKAPKEQK